MIGEKMNNVRELYSAAVESADRRAAEAEETANMLRKRAEKLESMRWRYEWLTKISDERLRIGNSAYVWYHKGGPYEQFRNHGHDDVFYDLRRLAEGMEKSMPWRQDELDIAELYRETIQEIEVIMKDIRRRSVSEEKYAALAGRTHPVYRRLQDRGVDIQSLMRPVYTHEIKMYDRRP